jgi:hypothetical protein
MKTESKVDPCNIKTKYHRLLKDKKRKLTVQHISCLSKPYTKSLSLYVAYSHGDKLDPYALN